MALQQPAEAAFRLDDEIRAPTQLEESPMNESKPRFNLLRQLGLVVLLALATLAVAHARSVPSENVPNPVVPRNVPNPDVPTNPVIAPRPAPDASIEVAFVLDTTGSMSGLIEGAKQKIWAIANQMAGAKQGAKVRIALIGYRDRGDAYVTKRFDLTDDSDGIYAHLRAFQAQGGGDTPESVNQALHEAVNDLSWTADDSVYRVVFLVGDAPPHTDYPQDVQYAATVRLAKTKGIVINTVQCGGDPTTTPIWREIASIGLGQYAAIAQDGGMLALATPMDEELTRLNRALASTVLSYGEADERRAMEEKVKNSIDADAPVVASRLSYLAKSGKRAISGMSDLVDAFKDGLDLGSVAKANLPAAMQPMSPEEQGVFVQQKLEERERVQIEIDDITVRRDRWVRAETERQRASGRADGFDATVFETVKKQAAAKGILYE